MMIHLLSFLVFPSARNVVAEKSVESGLWPESGICRATGPTLNLTEILVKQGFLRNPAMSWDESDSSGSKPERSGWHPAAFGLKPWLSGSQPEQSLDEPWLSGCWPLPSGCEPVESGWQPELPGFGHLSAVSLT
jgi:hypothetical protein